MLSIGNFDLNYRFLYIKIVCYEKIQFFSIDFPIFYRFKNLKIYFSARLNNFRILPPPLVGTIHVTRAIQVS